MICQWYLLCDNPAVGVVEHPVLLFVACCQRCADRHALALLPGEFVPDGSGGFLVEVAS